MVLCCWGFYENVSRETFFSSGEENTNIAITVCVHRLSVARQLAKSFSKRSPARLPRSRL
jgi:hypothetical protein